MISLKRRMEIAEELLNCYKEGREINFHKFNGEEYIFAFNLGRPNFNFSYELMELDVFKNNNIKITNDFNIIVKNDKSRQEIKFDAFTVEEDILNFSNEDFKIFIHLNNEDIKIGDYISSSKEIRLVQNKKRPF